MSSVFSGNSEFSENIEYFLCTTCIAIFVAASNLQPHTDVLPVSKGLTLSRPVI